MRERGKTDKLWAGPNDVVTGPVRFANAGGVARYSARHFRPRRDAGFFSLKAPLRVDEGERVRIELALVNRGHAWLPYKRAKHPADVLDVVACSGVKHTVWLGAIVVDGAQCIRLRVIRRGTTSIVRIPFGRGACGRA